MNKNHWETIYETKASTEVSWTQDIPQTSLDFVKSFNLDKTAEIIDVGGGESRLVDCLLELGYENITVLDISENALERTKVRLGEKASLVTWIVVDLLDFIPDKIYDLWHDRAVFHFFTTDDDINRYKSIVSKHARNLVLGTFSKTGPLKCSGLPISQYDEMAISGTFCPDFSIIQTVQVDHTTPFETIQNFTFCALNNNQFNR